MYVEYFYNADIINIKRNACENIPTLLFYRLPA